MAVFSLDQKTMRGVVVNLLSVEEASDKALILSNINKFKPATEAYKSSEYNVNQLASFLIEEVFPRKMSADLFIEYVLRMVGKGC